MLFNGVGGVRAPNKAIDFSVQKHISKAIASMTGKIGYSKLVWRQSPRLDEAAQRPHTAYGP